MTAAAPVGIVGAGPIGLVAALRLADLGVASVILEAGPELLRQGSKACLIHGDALEILDRSGCAEVINAEGVTWTVARTYVRNEVIRTDVYPRPAGFGPFVNISQYRIEQVLAAEAARRPLCDLRWGHRVTGVSQDGDGVSVTVAAPGGEQELRFSYLIACDGVRSTLRGMVGVEWTGYTHKDCFLITDIKARLPFDVGRHFHYDPSFNPGRQLVIHPQPDDIWRIDWQLPPDADIDAERASGAFDARVRAVIGDLPYEIDWVSTYRFHQRLVRRLREGRIFFAGDAAHALPPYGSRGMNSGIQDADNLAWKLALTLSGQAGPGLLETYHSERHAAARENLRVTEQTIRFMVPPNWARRQARRILLRLCSPLKSVRRHVNSGKMTEPYVYADSPIVQRAGSGAAAGSGAGSHPPLGGFAPDGPVGEPGLPDRLRQLFGAGFVGLYFAAGLQDAARFAEQAAGSPWQAPGRLALVLPPGAQDPPPGSGLPGSGLPGAMFIRDQSGALAAAYGGTGPRWWLIRPDGHLAATGGPDQAAEFAAALSRAAGGRPESDRAGARQAEAVS